MFKVQEIPRVIVPFFEDLKRHFLWDHHAYCQTLVFLIAFAYGRRNVSNLYRHLDGRQHSHRSRFNNFFLVGRWDPKLALREKANHLLSDLKPKAGETIYLLLDDSKNKKRGKKMEAVSKLKDPVNNCFMMGHQYVTAVLWFRGRTIPFGISLYVKKGNCKGLGLEFRKVTEMAAEFVGAFEPPPGVKVRVLFDSYYLCPVVVNACRKKNFRYISTLKRNRNLFKNGRKLKAGAYGLTCFRKGKCQTVRPGRSEETTAFRYVDAGWLEVSDLGRHHLIYSRREGDHNHLAIVTDDPDLSASDIVTSYAHRWHIEVFFKDAKQLLGLGQYQNGSYWAAVIHLHLVCFAYALLTHIAIQREGAKGKTHKKAASLSTAQLQNELRRMAWDELTKRLKNLESASEVIQLLDELLLAA